MKKIFVFTTLLAVSLVLSGCLAQKNPQNEASPKEKGTESYTFKALKAAITLGIPLKCSYKVNDIEVEGYVKGKQWRGKMKFNDGRVGEVIMKDNCMYNWEEANPQGMKMCFEKDIWENEQSQETTSDVEYRCAPTAVDDGKFMPPATVNFMDLDQLNKQGADSFKPNE